MYCKVIRPIYNYNCYSDIELCSIRHVPHSHIPRSVGMKAAVLWTTLPYGSHSNFVTSVQWILLEISLQIRGRMETGTFIQEFIAGNVGGLVGICVVYPLDTAKIRMQTYKSYTSTSDVLLKMVKIDGVGSLYRGLASPALGFGLTFAISFRLIKSHITVFSCFLSFTWRKQFVMYSSSLFLWYSCSAYGFSSRQIANFRGKDTDHLTLSEMGLAGIFTGFIQSPVRCVYAVLIFHSHFFLIFHSEFQSPLHFHFALCVSKPIITTIGCY